MSVPSSELGTPPPLPQASVSPSGTKGWGDTLACGWRGGGGVVLQYCGRLDKKPSTLSTVIRFFPTYVGHLLFLYTVYTEYGLYNTNSQLWRFFYFQQWLTSIEALFRTNAPKSALVQQNILSEMLSFFFISPSLASVWRNVSNLLFFLMKTKI